MSTAIDTEINSVTVALVNGAEPASTVNLSVDDKDEVMACPHDQTNQNGVTFSISVTGIGDNLRALTSIYYKVFSRLKWNIGMKEAQLVGAVNNSAVTFAVIAAQGTNPATATGTLTLYFPEKLAGAQVAVCFGLTEASLADMTVIATDVANPGKITPEIKPGIDQPFVKYLNIKSSATGAPLISSVHWSASEAIEFGTQTAERTDICKNEDAFLHIHTRGLFGKRVTVKLYGKSRNSTDASTTDSTQSILLKQRDYMIKDNVLCIAFPMSDISKVFYPAGQKDTEDLSIEAKVIVTGSTTGEESSGEMTLSGEEADNPAKANTGTTKYIIGKPENRPAGVEEAASEVISADLNIHVGTLTFLSGGGEESSTTISASTTGLKADDNCTETASTYFTYLMTTYELKLQDFIDAGVIQKSDIVSTKTETDKEGNETTIEELNSDKIYTEEYTTNGVTTKIYGFKETFRKNTIQARLTTPNGNQNIDYSKAKKLKEAAIANSRTVLDERRMCRSAWQLRKGSDHSKFPKYKKSPFRYTSNHECPAGAFYLIPPYGQSYLVFVGDTPNSASITHWTVTTLIGNNTMREQIKKPNSNKTDYISSSRTGIAIHRGRCANAVGCITFDNSYVDTSKLAEMELFNNIFSGDNGEFQQMSVYSTNTAQRKGNAALKIHIIMIEERKAAHRSDISTTEDPHPLNRYKGE